VRETPPNYYRALLFNAKTKLYARRFVPQLRRFQTRSILMVQTASMARMKDGCQIARRIYANPGKPRLALIHSLALSGAMWSEVIAQLAGAAEILVYDCRGHGQSERRPGPYSVELFADDLAALLDSCGWSSAIVAGCSMGGCVAQAFAAAYPERVRGLALIDTTAWYGPTAPKDWKARGERPAKEGLPSMVEFQLSRWFSDSFRNAHPDVANQITQIFLANDAASYQAACEMLGNADLRTAVRAFRMPVSVIVGEEDYATPVAMSQFLHESIPNSTLSVIPGARHTTPVECPREIAAFLGDLVGKSAAVSR
jgi:3-oxoadipate enol-lactonase